MKKLWGFWLLLSLFVFSNNIWAQQSGVCEEQDRITIRSSSSSAFNRTRIINALRNYAQYTNSSHDAILICFEQEPDVAIEPFTSPLTLINTSDLPVIISGLNIQAGEALGSRTLLRLSGTSPVTVINSSFQNCANCLSINGNGFQIENVAVVCSPESAGIGIRLRGNNHIIQDPGTDISQCGIGVQIGVLESANLLPGNNIQITNATLHNNGTAIYVLKGTGNYFRENSIYENDSGDGNYSGIEGILLGTIANGDLTVPMIQNSARPLQYAPEVREFPEDDSAVTATLTVQSPYAGGELEVDFTTERGDEYSELILVQQGKELYAQGVLLSSELQTDGSYFLTYQIPMRKSVKDKQAVLLFHHLSLGTSSYSTDLTLNGPIGVLSAAELEAPGVTGVGGTPPAGTGLGATNPPANEDEKKKDEGHSMAEAGTVTSGGLGSGTGVSVGVGKGCGSIVGAGVAPSNGKAVGASPSRSHSLATAGAGNPTLDFFLAPLVFLIALLAFRKKIL